MTGFSPEWLDLREPADIAARSERVLTACERTFRNRGTLSLCDMGTGTGATLRALAALLPHRQDWTLVDNDDGNLAAAGERLAAWAGGAGIDGDKMVIRRGERRIAVRRLRHDLVPAPRCWPDGTDLVVASALFDLASEDWIGRFVSVLADDGLPILATLTFDGEIGLDPPHELDGAIADAFRLHQGRDKGFGPAAGPRAPGILAVRLEEAGYEVTTGGSPWLLGADRDPLRTATADGIAAAVGETGLLDVRTVDEWRQAARRGDRTLRVGHIDLFATLPAQDQSRG